MSNTMTLCVMSKLPANTKGGEKECPQCGAIVRVTAKGRYWSHWRSVFAAAPTPGGEGQ